MTTVEFRTPEQEIEKLLEECHMLRVTLKEISAQVSRMENRVKRAFPASAEKAHIRRRARSDSTESSLTPEQALAEFDRAVQLAKDNPSKAESFLLDKPFGELVAIARELGVSFRKAKPSHKAVKEALYGRIRESLLLSQHHTRRSPAA